MLTKRILFALIMLSASFTASSEDVLLLPFKVGKPDATEFRLAAVRSFYKRNYEITTIDPERVVAWYRGGTEMEIALQENGIAIRNPRSNRMNANYANNLKRELMYELAAYLIFAPSSEQQAAGGQNLAGAASTGPNKNDITGTYRDNFDMDVRLKQKGTIVTGSFGPSQEENTIKGIRSGDEIIFTFRYSQGGFAHKKGKGKIAINEDGSILSGFRSGGRLPKNDPWTLKYESSL